MPNRPIKTFMKFVDLLFPNFTARRKIPNSKTKIGSVL